MFLIVTENKIEEANNLRKRFLDQSKLLQKRVRELMSVAKRDMWMCDMMADFYGMLVERYYSLSSDDDFRIKF